MPAEKAPLLPAFTTISGAIYPNMHCISLPVSRAHAPRSFLPSPGIHPAALSYPQGADIRSRSITRDEREHLQPTTHPNPKLRGLAAQFGSVAKIIATFHPRAQALSFASHGG